MFKFIFECENYKRNKYMYYIYLDSFHTLCSRISSFLEKDLKLNYKF